MVKLRNKSERGQAAIMVTLSLPLTVAMIGLVVDVGWYYFQQQCALAAAESAALAGATQVYKAGGSIACNSGVAWCNTTPQNCASSPTYPPTNSYHTACLYAKQNGYTQSSTQTIKVEANNTGAPTAPHTSNIYYVTVRVTQKLPLTFLSVIGAGQWTYVQARATAGVNASDGGSCIYVLDASADKAYSATGGNISTSCDIHVNSSKSDAAYMSGGVLNLNNGADFIIHGQLSNGGGNIVPSGNVLQNQPSVANPFSGMTAPTPAGSCITDPNISAGNNITLNPGTYCGLTISGGTNIYFNSGTYIIKTGSLTISGGTFSNTLSNLLIYIPASNTTGKINLNGVNGSGMNWSGLVGGNQDGFLFWVANSAAQTVTGGPYNLNGVMYMPTCAFQYTGGNGSQQTLVVDTLTITGGNITSSAPSSFFSGGGQAGGAFLVE